MERFSLFTTGLTYALLVLGNVVRGTRSGLSYLSWPLYHGRLVPEAGQVALRPPQTQGLDNAGLICG